MDQQPNDPIEEPALIRHDLPAEEPKRPPLILAPIWLFFRPRNFFLHYVTEPVAALTAVFALLFGLARAFDKLQLKMAQGKLTFVADSWAAYWMLALLSGCLGGLLYFYLGGWWYRVRLKWCGAQKPDAQLARRLYLYASQILAIPVVIVTVIDSFTFTTPMQAMQSDAMWQIILVIFPFWSVFASFLGARAIFDIGLFRALIWFAALPAIFYFISMGLVIVLLWFSPVFLEANITNTKHFENASFALEYPGNWDMDLSDDFHDYESLIWIDAISDAYIWFSIYEPTGSLEEEFDATLSDFRADYGKTAMTGSAANTWAGFACFGKTGSFTYEGTRYDVQIIVIPIGDEMNADIVTVWNPKMLEYTRPGFDLIERTFRGRAN